MASSQVSKYGTGQELTQDASPQTLRPFDEQEARPMELSVAATATMKYGLTPCRRP
jgi:hypothetical protein